MNNIPIKLLLLFPILSHSQSDYRLHPVQVTASRLTTSLAAETREIQVIDQATIRSLPGISVADILSVTGSVDLQQRGVNGVQADMGLRGSGFEQVLVLIDGVRMNDPQTGHHNADFPVSRDDIERIEILTGHASSMYGPDAVGGVIHIITRNAHTTGTKVSIKGGSFGTTSTQISQDLAGRNLNSRFTVEHGRSDGYRPTTDYEVSSLSNTSRWQSGAHKISASTGYITKNFGANGFYAPYPSHEATESALAALTYSYTPHCYWQWLTRLHARQHDDDFILDENRPDLYHNIHRSRSFGMESFVRWRWLEDLQIAAGGEWLIEDLSSESLGNHDQMRTALFTEAVWNLSSRTVLNTGMRMDRHSGWGLQTAPSANLSHRLSDQLKWRSAAGRIFRAPTFTELYYNSPANLGDAALKPEQGWNLETGLDWNIQTLQAGLTLFYRNEKDRIDWIKFTADDPWQAVNLGSLETRGLSITVSNTESGMISWRTKYAYLDQTQAEHNYNSKYRFNLLRHHLTGILILNLPLEFHQTWTVSVKQRREENAYTLLNTQWARNFGRIEINIAGTNLLNTRYEEIQGVPMPGRHFMGGLEMRIEY